MSRLWLPALPAALLFSAAFFFMLPLGAATAPKAAGALLLGSVSALVLVFRQKREHLRRHEREALFLGFSCRVKGSLWSPFARVELLLEKAVGDPEEDRLLYGLVRMCGPDYEQPERQLAGAGTWAAVCAAGLAVAMGGFRARLPALLPLFSLAALVSLLSYAENIFEKFELNGSSDEENVSSSSGSGYKQWNFLSLEAKRKWAGRIQLMESDIKRVLLVEAGLAAGSRVLEVGAGGGFLWKHIPAELRPGWAQAEKDPRSALYAERHRNGTSFRVTDVKSLPFEDASLDAVVGLECFDSLNFEDLSGFLPEAMRVLKPGGRLVHLKDFPDWPGHLLAERFNTFAMRALRLEPVSMTRGLLLKFDGLAGQEVSVLAAAVNKERGLEQACARVLAGVYAAGPRSDRRFSLPMFVSAMVLREIFRDYGFGIAADCLGPGDAPGIMTYIVARKPA
jgi:ubiquinone/menaquinone biosynthesis C-methylase UbiE